MEDILLSYDINNKLNIIVNYFTSKIIIDNIEEGNFKLYDNFLYIDWNNGNVETFIKDDFIDNILVYKLYDNNKDEKILNSIEDSLLFTETIVEENIENLLKDLSVDKELFTETIVKDNIENLLNDLSVDKELFSETIVEKYKESLEEIYIENNCWIDYCIINKDTKYLYRKNNINEDGYIELLDNNLIINWTKWPSEKFIYDNGIYKKYINREILVYHKDWKEVCIINESLIFKKSNIEEKGTYEIINNILTIYWEKWDKELFYEIG